jgi:hypothetical protein
MERKEGRLGWMAQLGCLIYSSRYFKIFTSSIVSIMIDGAAYMHTAMLTLCFSSILLQSS